MPITREKNKNHTYIQNKRRNNETYIIETKIKIEHVQSCPPIRGVKNYRSIYLSKKIYICTVGLWVLRPLTGLLYQPRVIGDGDCGEIGGMKIGMGNRSNRRKHTPAPVCPPQIPHD
jgi:hypothetical protein